MTDQPPLIADKTFLQRVRTYFITGLVVASPVGITIYIALAFIDLIDRNIKPLIPAVYNPDTYLPFPLPGIGLVFLFLLLTLLGFLAANFMGRTLIRIGEKILNRMPVVRSVYNTLKQIFETVISENKGSFQEVVLVEYPRKGLWAIAFISGDNTGEIQSKLPEDVINVFLPTTPNPTSGFLLFVPKKDIIILNMTPDQGAKYVISAGLVDPSSLPIKDI
ncbi:DUF502 domain-containing protein [Paremcibacter congregatus]|uniref:DUF502 domain-containing protein n=1 Tax=Paremcibacter congregatus TaxID=2043170 RepID=A0A2G4YNG5_9PROT|nr:DUF502 domain-containing protein [Paremcibacter congregatus]PHZ83833.1 hypothetical protein CRD36_15890 [Paremcibacter congregatus]QDE27537.1 DUF502 domain-containing protein [Paremcibacter congregatus]